MRDHCVVEGAPRADRAGFALFWKVQGEASNQPRDLVGIFHHDFDDGRDVDRIVVGADKAGEITLSLQARLLDVAQGRVDDPYGWLTPVQQRKEVPVG